MLRQDKDFSNDFRSWNQASNARRFLSNDIDKAPAAFEVWITETEAKEMEQFYSVANSLKAPKETILNFFNNRSTNASVEFFNVKIKRVRTLVRGVSGHEFFLFRLSKLFS